MDDGVYGTGRETLTFIGIGIHLNEYLLGGLAYYLSPGYRLL